MKKEKNQTEEKAGKMVLDQYQGVKTVDANNVFTNCHTFKLEQTFMLKDVSPFKNDPMILSIEHCHIFHTYDSNGNVLKTSNSVGGHYHDIDLSVVNENWKAVCSLPRSNKTSKELLDKDRHVHNVLYIKSGEIKLRKINTQAMQMIADLQSKEG